MKLKFQGRDAELTQLHRLWTKNGAQLLILYGRRRIGKTALIKEWVSNSGTNSLYWMARTSPPEIQLRQFSQAIYNFANPQLHAPEDFSYGNWQQAFEQVGALAQNERFGLFIDEFTYLIQAMPDIVSVLQDLWDHYLANTKLFLCLSGSHLGMMKRELLAPRAPLYGRASAQLHLQPLPFGVTSLFFPKYSAADRVRLYSLFGGVPAYWERVTRSASITQNIKNELLTPGNLMQEEPALLLQDFLRDPRYYIGILKAIALGHRTIKAISTYAGMPESNLPKYLGVLIEAGFVHRKTPVTKAETSRSGRYEITDPYLRFYYRFLEGRQDQLAMGVKKPAIDEIRRRHADFIGTYTWEELCREWLLKADETALPFSPDKVGSAWGSGYQCDVVGINTAEKTFILGECKWRQASSNHEVIESLLGKTKAVIPPSRSKKPWQVYYLGFSRSGWTAQAKTLIEEINASTDTFDGPNWKAAGIRLLDLKDIDQALQKWAESNS
jgi:AAA+ ATPase superfamily predicted ATPase